MQVTIYSTPSCSWCRAAKQFLAENDIPFEDVDVSRDRTRAEEMVQKSGQMGVPVIDIDGEIIVGFDRPRLTALLGLG
ncbi:MAG: glutaredoxin family protein [Symbiobacteriia bacterium]